MKNTSKKRAPPRALRLREFFRRLAAAPPASSTDEALTQVHTILTEVENELTAIPYDPTNWKTDGRMYAPLRDRVKAVPGQVGLIQASAKRHTVYVSANGAILVTTLDGRIVFDKAGRDGNSIQHNITNTDQRLK